MTIARTLKAAACAAALAGASAAVAQPLPPLDPQAVSQFPVANTTWQAVGAPGSLQHRLYGPAEGQTGGYASLLKWTPGNFSRPHCHRHDRFIMVLSGVWWVGTGTEFVPDSTTPMPAGTMVTHYAGGVHYDGAKSEDAVLLISGIGPAPPLPLSECAAVRAAAEAAKASAGR